MKNVVLWILKTFLAGCEAIFILSICISLYYYDGSNVKNMFGTTEFTKEPYSIVMNMKEGFSCNRMDENGFNNIYIPDRGKPNVLLVGSSQVEGKQIAVRESMTALLNKMLVDKSVYNIGMGNHKIAVCVKHMEEIMHKYDSSKFIILETETVEPDNKSMMDVLNEQYENFPVYDEGLIYFLQKKIPVIKTIYKQVDYWIEVSSFWGEEIEAETYIYPEGALLDHFLDKAVLPIKENNSKLIIFYHPETKLDKKGKLMNTTNPNSLLLFQELCEEKDITFVDLTEDFEQLYEENHVLPYGFINSSVGTGHLNKYGHKVIAERLYQTIISLERVEN